MTLPYAKTTTWTHGGTTFYNEREAAQAAILAIMGNKGLAIQVTANAHALAPLLARYCELSPLLPPPAAMPSPPPPRPTPAAAVDPHLAVMRDAAEDCFSREPIVWGKPIAAPIGMVDAIRDIADGALEADRGAPEPDEDFIQAVEAIRREVSDMRIEMTIPETGDLRSRIRAAAEVTPTSHHGRVSMADLVEAMRELSPPMTPSDHQLLFAATRS